MRWVDSLKRSKRFSIDTETTSVDPIAAELVGVCLATIHEDAVACYIPVGHETGEKQLPLKTVLKALKPVLADPSIAKVLHNSVYDLVVLRKYGLEFTNVEDTQFMSYALDGKTLKHWHGMDDLAPLHLNHKMIEFREVVIPGLGMRGFQDVRIDHATQYAAEDADVTLDLFYVLRNKLKEAGLWSVYTRIDRPCIPAFVDMKWNGVAVSRNGLAKLEREWSAARDDAAEKLKKYGLVKLTPAGIAAFLFGTGKDQLGLEPLKTTKEGNASVDAEVLEALDDDEYPEIKLIQTWAKYSKLVSTYAVPLQEVHPDTGLIHTELKTCFTNTGRLSSANPNLQNIPTANNDKHAKQGEQIRQCFVARKGHKLVCADYSQIELRVLAHISGDRTLVDAFNAGIDAHSATAASMFGTSEAEVGEKEWKLFRYRAKRINFGLVYGMTNIGLSKQLKIDPDEAQELVERYFSVLPGVEEYIENEKAFVRKHGYNETLWGRRVYQPGVKGNRAMQGHAERAGINAPIQGSASDLLRLAMGKLPGEIAKAGLSAKMLLQVHDELVFEAPDDEVEETSALLKRVMETAGDGVDWMVPIVAEVEAGTNWNEAH